MEWLALVLVPDDDSRVAGRFPGGLHTRRCRIAVRSRRRRRRRLRCGISRHTAKPLVGIMSNETMVAVPLFVFMGSCWSVRASRRNCSTPDELFGRLRGGLAISVTIVGMLLAASTGIVGATVVTMGLLSLPTMLKRGYSPALRAARSVRPERSARSFRHRSYWCCSAMSCHPPIRRPSLNRASIRRKLFQSETFSPVHCCRACCSLVCTFYMSLRCNREPSLVPPEGRAQTTTIICCSAC